MESLPLEIGLAIFLGLTAVTVLFLCVVAAVKFLYVVLRLPIFSRVYRWKRRRKALALALVTGLAFVLLTEKYLGHFLAVQVVWRTGGIIQYAGGESFVNVVASDEYFLKNSGQTFWNRFTGPVVAIRCTPYDWAVPSWVLHYFPDLEYLGMNSVQKRDLWRIGKLKKLEGLTLHATENLDDGVHRLLSLKLLEHLRINGYQALGDTGAEQLSQLESLEGITILESGALTDRGVESLARLRLTHLIVSGRGITDACLPTLYDCPLEFLSVPDTSVSNTGLLRIRAAITGLSTNPEVHAENPRHAEIVQQIGHLVDFDLDDEGRVVAAHVDSWKPVEGASYLDPSKLSAFGETLQEPEIAPETNPPGFDPIDAALLAQLSDLRRLAVSGEGFDDAVAHELTPLHGLEEIEFGRSSLTAEGVRMLTGLPNVSSAVFESVALKSDTIEALAASESLDSLELNWVEIDAESASALDQVIRLKRLILYYCEFPMELGAAWRKLPNLKALEIKMCDTPKGWVANLEALDSLDKLVILGADLSDEQIEALQQKLPGCEIISDYSPDEAVLLHLE